MSIYEFSTNETIESLEHKLRIWEGVHEKARAQVRATRERINEAKRTIAQVKKQAKRQEAEQEDKEKREEDKG